jgi:hypothetical protein
MGDGNDGAHAPGAAGQPGAGGNGAAGTPPSVDALVQALAAHAGFNQLLTGAAVGHAKRIEDRLSKQLEDLAGRLPAAPANAGKIAQADEKTDLAAQLKAAQDQAAKFQQRYLSERKQSALTAALTKHGCRHEGVAHALQLLMARGDIREVTGANGQPTLVGTTQVSGVEQDVPVDDAVRAWLTANPLYLPPTGSGGSGASGGRSAAGPTYAGRPVDQMTAEEVQGLPKEERRKLAAQLGVGGAKPGGFWDMI